MGSGFPEPARGFSALPIRVHKTLFGSGLILLFGEGDVLQGCSTHLPVRSCSVVASRSVAVTCSLSLSVRVALVAGVEGASRVVVISSGGDCDRRRKDGVAWRCA